MLVSCNTRTSHCLTRCKQLFKIQSISYVSTRGFHQENVRSTDRVIFSGIQPTGVPHIGNYLGALQQWAKLQETSSANTKLIFSIADLHAITSLQDSSILKKWKREALAILLAVGLRPERCVIFYQSSVPAHVELMWILSCTASMGYLSRMTQWKSKLQLASDASPLSTISRSKLKLGLFSYPVLQAADILVHRATHVPVGEDQSQHIEFARECVTNFNHAYGALLKAPITITSTAKRVMSLQEPHLKMSKSHQDHRSRILLTDNADEVHRKIMAALTDSKNFVSYDPVNRPGVANLLQLLSYFSATATSPERLGEMHASLNLASLKTLVSQTISHALSQIRPRFKQIMAEDDGRYIDHIALQGTKRASENAAETMAIVREATGL